MNSFLDRIFRNLIAQGSLRLRWPDGTITQYRGVPGPSAAMRLCDRSAVQALLLNPALALGEGYMNGTILAEDGGIYDLLHVLMLNLEQDSHHPMLELRASWQRRWRRWAQYNPIVRARRNVAHHYDLDGRLYSLFLDRDRQYSCAYFATGAETLEEAQTAKKRHIAAKLKLDRPGLHVLDIGCGWGGMALMLARDFGAIVTGITLSEEQLAESRARAKAEGLEHQVRFELRDYREITGPYDRIVSVGMFEHVGIGHYQEFFAQVYRLLAPDGVALLHTIGRIHGPSITNPWITKYIFPGGYSPALSEIMPPLESSGLFTTDVEVLRLHYAETIRHWRRRFAANRDVITSLYDERFCRMFEFYLAGSELSFRVSDHVNFQIQLTRDAATLPLTRDYMTQAERVAGPQVARN
jgi:cyclopropane-fatty-acyl-phospholipid synthase